MAAGREVVALALWLFVLFTVSFLAASRRMRDDLSDDVFAPQRRGAGMEYGGRRGGGNGGGKKHHQLPPPDRKPNIILILTDDQDVELGSLNFMPRTLRLLRDGGAEFRHAYVTTPMCCPSRSSLLTGMYVHNHHVFTNNDNCSSATWQATHETRSFATYLSNAGYRTGYFGKYLNKYNGSYIPPGWREWGGLIMNSRYYNYSINLNGKKIKHGADYHKDYYPDLIANDSVTFLRQSKQYFSRKPVMLVLSFPAPHGPEDSAPQFSHLFFNVTTHHTPAYDYAPNPDKQWILKVTPRMQPIHRQFTDLLMTKRLQTLQSVDEAVEKIYQELKALGELDNTYIIYTSDHGYHLGQFGLVKGKSFPFEFDVRVPFLVRGPDIEPGTIIDDIVLNLDLAPTFLDIAGVEPPAHMDGRSFLKLLHRNPKHGQMSSRRKKLKWPDTFLIESSGRRETPENVEAKLNLLKLQQQARLGKVAPDSTKISTEYPLSATDENALNNTANALPVSEDTIAAINRPDLQIDNRVLPVVSPGISKLERIALECQSPEYQAPCKPGQKWQCVSEGNRWRKHKCKFQSAAYPRGGTGGKRKCACFTPAGLVYTRLEPDERRMQRQFLRGHVNKNIKEYKPKFLRTVQAKRIGEVDLADLLHQSSGLLDEDAVADFMARYNNHDVKRRGSRRSKRDTLENLADSIMKDIEKDIEKELHGLQEKDADGKSGVPSDAENMIQLAGCAVSPSHTVNCSNAVYEDLPTWRSSKSNVDDAIRKLLAQVEVLKEIRRHLREKRPQDTSSYDASAEETDEENTEDEDESDATGASEDTDLSLEEVQEKGGNEEEEGILIGSEKEDNNHTKSKDHRKVHRGHKHLTPSTTEDYVSTESSHRFAGTTEHTTTTMHHRHHHTPYPLSTSAPEDDSTTAQPAHVRAPVEITWREYLDLNISTEAPSTEGPSTAKSQHKARLPKPTNNENKLGVGPSRIDVTVYQPQRPNNGRVLQENSSISETSNLGGRVFSLFPTDGQGQHTCYCEPDNKVFRNEEKEIAKEARQRIKEERLKKKERKLKKKAKLEKECLAEKMNCFNHDNDHWKTAPLWTEGPFCFCMNANNNTYSCLRTINATHNFLYCEFVTGLVTFYNLRIDPFEQWNRVHSLTEEELRYLRDQLAQLKACRGTKQCTVGSAAASSTTSHSAGNAATLTSATRYKKRKYANAGLYGPSPAMHLASQSHLLPPTNKKRKKLPKPWRRRKAWQNQWHQRRRRFRQYFQQYQQ